MNFFEHNPDDTEEPDVLVTALLMLEFRNPMLKEKIESLEEKENQCKNILKRKKPDFEEYDTSEEDEPSSYDADFLIEHSLLNQNINNNNNNNNNNNININKNEEGNNNNGNKKSRAGVPRKRASAKQVVTLEEHFYIDQFPKGEIIEQIAEKTGMPPSKVKNWFQNKRAKERRLSKIKRTSQIQSPSDIVNTNINNNIMGIHSLHKRNPVSATFSSIPTSIPKMIPQNRPVQLPSVVPHSHTTIPHHKLHSFGIVGPVAGGGAQSVFLGPSLTDHLNRL